MKKVFEKLWYSNIFESDCVSKNQTIIEELTGKTYEMKEQILAVSEEKLSELIEEYDETMLDLVEYSEQEAFVKGFRLGAQIMLGIFDNE